MAKTLVVVLTCDRCAAEGIEGSEGTESVGFAFDGYSYNLDLCAEHGEEFHNTIQSMVSWASERSRLGAQRRARRTSVDASSASGPPDATPVRTSGDRARLKAIREWARKHGHPDLSDRGRIPQTVLNEYEAAHKG